MNNEHSHGCHSAPIFINKVKYEVGIEPLKGQTIKALGGYGDDYDLFLLGEDGDRDSKPIKPCDEIQIKPGMRFRALPGNRNFGEASIHPDIGSAVSMIRGLGLDVQVKVSGQMVGIIIADFPLPQGVYNQGKVRLLLQTPTSPCAAMDMFWTAPELRLASGGVPQAADSLEHHFGEHWRRFSWHPQSEWKPGRDNPFTYLALVEDRLERGV